MSQKPTILFDNEYCHVVDNTSGIFELIEGPQRFVLPPHKSMHKAKQKKLVLKEGEYTVLTNPYNLKEKRNILGAKMVLKGPLTRSLYPQESSEGVKKATILLENQGAIILARNDFEEHKAGEKWIVRGPTSYIPNRFAQYLKTISAVQVSQNEAVYVRNILTSKLKLVKGPVSYMPNVDEELYSKVLSSDEVSALKLSSNNSYMAFQIQVQKQEAVCIVDHQTNTEKYVIGPNGYQLGPHEGIKVIDGSGGIPKKEHQKKLGVIRLGPDFMQDGFDVRTKDNAVLELVISYKWRFLLDDLELFKIFHGDFVGYSCQSMRSRVREVVSKYDFEQFHTNSSTILRERLFKKYEKVVTQNKEKKKLSFGGRFFQEFNFLIFQLDVKHIGPKDKEIERLLNDSIKSSMKIMVQKKKEQAQVSQTKSEIKNKVEIAKMKTKLIELDNMNYKKQTLERSRIEGTARVETARAQMKADQLMTTSKLDLEVLALKEKMELLSGTAGDAYIEYVKANNLGKNVNQMTVVPEGMQTLFVGKSMAQYIEE